MTREVPVAETFDCISQGRPLSRQSCWRRRTLTGSRYHASTCDAFCRHCRPVFGTWAYMIRGKVPRGLKLMPHRHPEGLLHRFGGEFDADKLEAYPFGAVIVLPGNTSISIEPSRARRAGECRWAPGP